MSADGLIPPASGFRKKLTFAALIAGLSGVVGLLSSLLTLYSQAGSVISAAIRKDFAPVGTVISSILEPSDFAKAVGEIEGDAWNRRKWVLADGREVNDTEYARMTKNKPIPNLKGMFLRGIDPEKMDRIAGSFQQHATALPKNAFSGTTSSNGLHSHSNGANYGQELKKVNNDGVDVWLSNSSNTGISGTHEHSVIIKTGGDIETRPNNVAVYYYIKIN